MVITANPPKFDKRQPARGDYDAIVYIEGSEVVADDRNGRKIASGVAGTNDETVIDAALGYLSAGNLVFEKGTYYASFAAKSNVNIDGQGSSIIHNSADTQQTLEITDVVNALITNLNLYRQGTPASQSYCLRVNGITDDSVTLSNIRCISTAATASSHAAVICEYAYPRLEHIYCLSPEVSHVAGLVITQYSHPRIVDILATSRGNASSNNSGIIIDSDAYPTVVSSIGQGSTSAIGYGIISHYRSHPILVGCEGVGSSVSNGIAIRDTASPLVFDCVAHGKCGLEIAGASRPIIEDVIAYSDQAGNDKYGAWIGAAANPIFHGGKISGGTGGTGCYAAYLLNVCSPEFYGTYFGPIISPYRHSYTAADNGQFRPFSGHPYILYGAIYILNTVTHPGVVLDIGTTPAASDIYNNLSLAVSETIEGLGAAALPEFASDAYMYATPDAGVNDSDFYIGYSVATNYSTCYALRMSSHGSAKFHNCRFLSNGSSDVVYVTVGHLYYIFDNCILQTLDPINQRVVNNASWGALFKDCKYYGLLTGQYLSSNTGSSTGTGSEQTIAHGLAAIPTGCKAWITYLVGTRYVTKMIPFDATNVYPTVDNGVAYAWRIE